MAVGAILAALLLPALARAKEKARQMPPLTGLRMVARDTWFYNDTAPELRGRAHDGNRRNR